MPASPDNPAIILNTLGKLYEHGYGMFGTCLDCSGLYRMDAPAEKRISAHFDIDLAKLAEERGADAPCIRMAPVPCPRCGSDRTECRSLAVDPGNHSLHSCTATWSTQANSAVARADPARALTMSNHAAASRTLAFMPPPFFTPGTRSAALAAARCTP
jgi:hypothetical protein